MEGELIHKDLTYKIIGIVYDVYNKLGYGYQEKFYQKAISLELKEKGISHKMEVFSPVIYNNETIGKCFLDFLIEEKVILELKRGRSIRRSDIEQIYNYLKIRNLKLGLLIRFAPSGVIVKRIVNIK